MKKILIFIFLLFTVIIIYSQDKPDKNKEIDDILEEIFEEEDLASDVLTSLKKYQYLYIASNFNSNTYFSGRDIGINQFNISPQIIYVNSNGFFASLSGIYYSEFVPAWDVTIFSIGYGKKFKNKKQFDYYISYSKYLYANDINNIYGNALNVGIGVKNKKRNLGTKLIGTCLFGSEQSYQIASNNFISFKIYKKNKSIIKLKPQLNITAGKQTIELAQIIHVNGGGLVTQYTETETFDLINTQLNIPFQYSFKSFDFELGYNINFPNPIGNEKNLDPTGYFNFSMAYLINL